MMCESRTALMSNGEKRNEKKIKTEWNESKDCQHE